MGKTTLLKAFYWITGLLWFPIGMVVGYYMSKLLNQYTKVSLKTALILSSIVTFLVFLATTLLFFSGFADIIDVLIVTPFLIATIFVYRHYSDVSKI